MGLRKAIAQKILEKVFVKGSLQIVLPDGDSFILGGPEKGGIVANPSCLLHVVRHNNNGALLF